MEGDMFPPEEVVSYINETVIHIFIQNEIHHEFPAHTKKFIQLFCIYRKTEFKRILIVSCTRIAPLEIVWCMTFYSVRKNTCV